MRIISGIYGGRLLKTPPSNMHFRPTTDRVRESLFNIIEHAYGCAGAAVVDLFAGTGSLGIEALSRGAESAVFVEKAPRHAGIIKENLKTLDLLSRSMVQIGSVERFVEGERRKFDLVFCDPPYAYEGVDRILDRIAERGLLTEGGILCLEHSGKTAPEIRPPWNILQTRSYGTTAITLLTMNME